MIYNRPGRYGDLKKFEVKVDDKDVSDAVSSLAIFQDLFTPTWSCQVFFNDTTNLILRLPIHVGSTIKIKIATELKGPGDGEKEFEMIVHRIGDKVFQNHMQQTYTCYCSSKAFLKNQTKRVQKAYQQQKPTDIASNIVSEFLGGTVETDTADQQIDCIIPNWSPFTAVAWLLKNATKKNAADFVFFQRDNDSYVMKSMETLYTSDDTGVTFKQRPQEVKKNGEYDEDHSVSVSDYQVEHSDAISNMASGYFQNKLVSYDLLNKKWDSKTFTFGDDCQEDLQKKAWDNPLFQDAADSNIVYHPAHPGMSKNSTPNDFASTWSGSRRSSVQKLDQEKIVIQVPGNIGANQWIGKTCKFDLPSQEDISGETLDKYRKGKYLIVAICHLVSKDGYSLNLEILKKRLEEKLETK